MAVVLGLPSFTVPSRKRRLGCKTYGSEKFPTSEVVYNSGPLITGENAQRRANDFFQVIDGASKLSDNSAVADVMDYLGLPGIKDKFIWDLNLLFAPTSSNVRVNSSMESFNGKLTADWKWTVSSGVEVITLATKSVELASSSLAAEKRWAVESLEQNKLAEDLKEAIASVRRVMQARLHLASYLKFKGTLSSEKQGWRRRCGLRSHLSRLLRPLILVSVA